MNLSNKSELVITTTNITRKVAEKHNVNLDTFIDSGMIDSPKDEIEEAGRYFVADEDKYTVFTATLRSQQEAFDSLTDDQVTASFWDGYKRKHINSPDAVSVKTTLGITEVSKTAQATYDRAIAENIDEATAKIIAGIK